MILDCPICKTHHNYPSPFNLTELSKIDRAFRAYCGDDVHAAYVILNGERQEQACDKKGFIAGFSKARSKTVTDAYKTTDPVLYKTQQSVEHRIVALKAALSEFEVKYNTPTEVFVCLPADTITADESIPWVRLHEELANLRGMLSAMWPQKKYYKSDIDGETVYFTSTNYRTCSPRLPNCIEIPSDSLPETVKWWPSFD